MRKIRRLGYLVPILAGLCPHAPAIAFSTQDDLPAFTAALNRFLPTARADAKYRWHNPDNNHAGEITALERTDSAGGPCWRYRRTYADGGVEHSVIGTACEVFEGFWRTQAERMEAAQKPLAQTRPAYSRDMVRETQSLLRKLGYDPGPADGAYGRRTRAAIEAYQGEAGQDVTGVPSANLLARLRSDSDFLRRGAGEDRGGLESGGQEAANGPRRGGTGGERAAPVAPSKVERTFARVSGRFISLGPNIGKIRLDGPGSPKDVFVSIDQLNTAARERLANDCQLCPIEVEGIYEDRELNLGTRSLGLVRSLKANAVSFADP